MEIIIRGAREEIMNFLDGFQRVGVDVPCVLSEGVKPDSPRNADCGYDYSTGPIAPVDPPILTK